MVDSYQKTPCSASTPAATTYKEIIEDTPVTKTTTTAASRLLGESYPFKYVLSYIIRVRSMGTCTYIGIGNEQAQEYRLTAVGHGVSYTCNRYEVVDLTKKYVIADQSDGVLEVMASFLPVNQYGKVIRVL